MIQTPPTPQAPRLELSEADVLAAMQLIPGYLDITPRDFQDLYRRAFHHALERLRTAVRAADIMTRDVASVQADTPLHEVAALMGQRRVSGVPVVHDDHTVAGIISAKDFLAALGIGPAGSFMTLVAQCLEQGQCLAGPLKRQTAAAIMTSPAICIPATAPVAEIVHLFATRRINRAPVIDAQGHLQGIVSRGDILPALFPGGQP